MSKKITLAALGVLAVALIIFAVASSVGKEDKPTVEAASQTASTTLLESITEAISETQSETQTTTKKEGGILAGLFSDKETTTEAPSTTVPQTAEKIEDYAYAYAGFEPAYADVDIDDWKLLLVNRDYILPDDYEVKLAPCITDDPDSLSLDYRVAPHYNEMYLAALEDGVELTPISGYRSVARQKRNFENKIQKYIDDGYSKVEATQMAATIILPPGTSEHNAGFAMDICSLYESFENTEEFEWLSENAADYGFILRYPEDKQDITNIIYEPWHWRYVGVEAAREMKASGECLEEYLGVVS